MRNTKEKKMPTQQRLKELLIYNKWTGEFFWKPRTGCRTNIPLGSDNGNGYMRITVDGVSYYAHRLAWIYENGDFTKEHIDHIDGDRSNNKILNLRPATPSENQLNRHGAQVNSKSGEIGVSWHKKAGKWQVFKSKKYLGLFDSIDGAVAAYRSAA